MHGVCTQESIVPLYYYVYFPPSGYVGEDAFHLISVMCRSHVSFTSIFYSQFTIDINLQVNSNKFIVKPPTESYVIYSGYFLPIYVKLPYKTLHLRVLLVAGGGTRGRPRLRLSPLPFPSALSSLLILQPPSLFNRVCIKVGPNYDSCHMSKQSYILLTHQFSTYNY